MPAILSRVEEKHVKTNQIFGITGRSTAENVDFSSSFYLGKR